MNNPSKIEDNDIDSLINLWGVCFTDDIEYLADYYMRGFPLTKTYVFKDNGKVISSISLFNLIYIRQHSGHNSNGGYLYGVCTDPKYRGNHLTSRLIEYAEDESEGQYDFLITRPASQSLFGLYRKIGFDKELSRSHIDLRLPEIPVHVNSHPISFNELFDRRKSNLISNYFEWDKYSLEYIIHYFDMANGEAEIIDGNTYLIGFPDYDDSLLYNVMEMGPYQSEDSSTRLNLISNLVKSKHPDKEKIRIYSPEKIQKPSQVSSREPYVLMKTDVADIDLSAFFNFTLE